MQEAAELRADALASQLAERDVLEPPPPSLPQSQLQLQLAEVDADRRSLAAQTFELATELRTARDDQAEAAREVQTMRTTLDQGLARLETERAVVEQARVAAVSDRKAAEELASQPAVQVRLVVGAPLEAREAVSPRSGGVMVTANSTPYVPTGLLTRSRERPFWR